MTSPSIVFRIARLAQLPGWRGNGRNQQVSHPNLHALAAHPEQLPRFVSNSPLTMRYLELFGPLAWNQFPERNLDWPTPTMVVPYAALPPLAWSNWIKDSHRLDDYGPFCWKIHP